jgi:flagellar hook-associated protein 3 FlgL
MRIATAYSNEASVSTLQQRQEALQRAQEQMTSGKRIARPSDDPAGMAIAERALQVQTRLESVQRAVASSRTAMTLTESAIGNASDLIQSARDTLLDAGNGSYSVAERQALAAKLGDIRKQLFSVANQTDGGSGFLFGDQNSVTPPFTDDVSGTGINPGGGGHERYASAADNLPLSVDGRNLWNLSTLDASAASANQGSATVSAQLAGSGKQQTGGNYTVFFSVSGAGTTFSVTDNKGQVVKDASGTPLGGLSFPPAGPLSFDGLSVTLGGTPSDKDSFSLRSSPPVFDTLDRMVAALSDPSASGAQIMQAVSRGVSNLDGASARMQSVRAQVGATLNRLDGMEGRNADAILAAQTTRSNAEDLDMVQAVSDFSNKQTSYQAALQSYSMVQKLSLFNYISS